MKTYLLMTATGALLLAAPLHSQLLGGGLAGGLGHTVSGALGGNIGASANKSIDRRSGRASAGGSADGMLGGTLDSATGVTGPNGQVSSSKSVRAEKRVSKSATVQADGPGTDDAGRLVGSVTDKARGVATGVVGAGRGAAHSAGGAAGSASGSAAGSGRATAGDGLLIGGTLDGSARGEGALEVGTLVRDAKGRAVGRIEELRQGAQTVLVDVGNRTVELPAGSLAADGEFATTAMSRAEIRKMAKAQERGTSPSS